MKIFRWLMLVGLIFFCQGGVAQAQETLKVVDETNIPFSFSQNGQRTGFAVELVEALAAAMNKKLMWFKVDFKGIIPMLQTGRADFSAAPAYINEERKKVTDFTDPFLMGGTIVLVRKNSPIQFVKDLDGHKVGVKVGSYPAIYLEKNHPQAQCIKFFRVEEQFIALQTGRVDAVVTGKPTAQWFIRTAPGGSETKILAEQLTVEPYRFIVSKNRPELTQALNQAIKKLKADGTYDVLYEK